MTDAVRLQPLARARVAALGEAGRTWHAGLPAVLSDLARRWSVALGRALPGGSASYVVEASTATGEPVVLKVAMLDPGFTAEADQLHVADGRGYARLLQVDHTRQAVLMERLGPSLATSGRSVEEQVDLLAATLAVAWRSVDRSASMSGPASASKPVSSDRARSSADAIRAHGAHVGPADEAVVERALAYASALSRTEPPDLVVAHGDAHPGNLLRVRVPRTGAETGWCFVDPQPCVAERAHDLGVAVRDFSSTLLAEPTTAVDRLWSWCHRVAAPSGADPARVWAWAFLERVSTGLYVRSFGAPRVAEPFLRCAALLAASPAPAGASDLLGGPSVLPDVGTTLPVS